MKDNKINCLKVVLLLLFLVTIPLKTFALDTEDGPDPPPGTPIDGYTYPAIAVTFAAALYFFYKKEIKKPLKQ